MLFVHLYLNLLPAGGALERPAVKFPSMFGNVRFFNDYPYALPGFVCSFVGLSAALLVTFYVKEVCFPLHHMLGFR